jgi:aminoglycoside 3-N-acetyltransferase I
MVQRSGGSDGHADVLIRRLQAHDVAVARATFAVMSKVFAEPTEAISDSYLVGLLSRPQFWAVAALVDDVPIGGLTAHTLPMTTGERSELLMYDVAVHPHYQRQGIGRHLLTFVRDQAAKANIDTVFVPVDNDDAHALDFYRAIGGKATQVTIFTWNNLHLERPSPGTTLVLADQPVEMSAYAPRPWRRSIQVIAPRAAQRNRVG